MQLLQPQPEEHGSAFHMKISDLVVVAFVDPAGGKSGAQKLKRTSARSAVIVIGVDSMCRIFVLSSWADRCPTSDLVAKLFKLNDDFHPKIFGVESNAMQALFADMLAREARALKKRVPFVPVPQSTRIDKRFRVRTALQPVIGEGRLFLQDNQLELKAELSTFPMSPVVDMVDALASAVMLAPKRALQIVRNEAVDALATYLRQSGATPRQINDRINELRYKRSA
jgi:hypothetical protein